MASVGIRDLKNALSHYIRRARSGEIIEITDRGEPVARIISAGVGEGLAKLLAEGRATWSGRTFVPPRNPQEPRPGSILASDSISRDRD